MNDRVIAAMSIFKDSHRQLESVIKRELRGALMNAQTTEEAQRLSSALSNSVRAHLQIGVGIDNLFAALGIEPLPVNHEIQPSPSRSH